MQLFVVLLGMTTPQKAGGKLEFPDGCCILYNNRAKASRAGAAELLGEYSVGNNMQVFMGNRSLTCFGRLIS